MKLFKGVGGFKYLALLAVLLMPSMSMAQNIKYDTKLSNAIWIASGFDTELISVNKFGHNGDIDIANDADLWSGGSQTAATDRIYTYEGFLSTFDSLQVVSTSANDSTGNGGLVGITIVGLDTNWVIQEVAAILTVTDTVTVSELFRRVYRVYGTSGFTTDPDTSINQGIILVETFTGTTRMAQIEIGKNQTEMAIATVPAGYTCYIEVYHGSMEKSTGATAFADIELWARPFGGVFRIQHEEGLASDGTSRFEHPFKYPIVLTEKTDFKLRVDTGKDAVDITGGMIYILIKH